MIHRTVFVTYPRSGHHALERVLHHYFGARWVYCESYQHPENMRLENNARTVAMKEHDLDLSYRLPANVRVVVQVRNPLRSIISWWYAELKRGVVKGPLTQDLWNYWMGIKMDFYHRFMNKWVAKPVAGRLVVCYEDLVNCPAVVAGRVIAHLTGQTELVDAARLREALSAHPISWREPLPIPVLTIA